MACSNFCYCILQFILTIIFELGNFLYALILYSYWKCWKNIKPLPLERFNAEKTPLITVIMPICNCQDVIELKLRHICEKVHMQTHLEVILVDRGSTDHTCDVIRNLDFETGTHVVTGLCQHKGSRGETLNAGIEKANGDIILFLQNVNTILPKHFDKFIRQTLETNHVAAFFLGFQRSLLTSPLTGLCLFEAFIWIKLYLFGKPTISLGLAIWKSTLRRVGKFPAHTLGEENYMYRIWHRCFGKIGVIRNIVYGSATRWSRLGVWKTNCLIKICKMWYWLGATEQQVDDFHKNGVMDDMPPYLQWMIRTALQYF